MLSSKNAHGITLPLHYIYIYICINLLKIYRGIFQTQDVTNRSVSRCSGPVSVVDSQSLMTSPSNSALSSLSSGRLCLFHGAVFSFLVLPCLIAYFPVLKP